MNIVFGLAALTLVTQIAAVVLLVALLGRKKNKTLGNISAYAGRQALWVSFVIFLTGMAGSLYFSEVMNWTPCILCWYQRILLYPQTLLFGVALWKNEEVIIDYSIVLSTLGALIGAYHYALQTWSNFLPAPCTGGESCAIKVFNYFGYITIPLMALTAFVTVIILLVSRKANR